jgi:hypothetical protein
MLSTALMGAATVGFAWVVATVFTMQTMVMSVGSAQIVENSLGPKSVALADPLQRLQMAALSTPSKAEQKRVIEAYAAASRSVAAIRMARIQPPAAAPAQQAANGAHAMPDAVRRQLIMRLAMANAAASPSRDTAALEPKPSIAVASLDHPHQTTTDITAPTRVKDDVVVASAAPSAPVATTPMSTTPAAGTGPTLAQLQSQVLASAEPDDGFATIAPPIPTARPDDADSVMMASLDTSDDAGDDSNSTGADSAEKAFGLVLSNPDSAVPLPMARPDDALRDAAPPGRTRNVPEQALAYARTEDDDDNSDMPSVRKPTTVQRAANGTAIYDIEAGMVYLPSGARLEAHSGLGNMRDNPRFVNQKNRGPTPPHTYALTLRESLFHGVQAIRLTPVGGQGAVYNRVGLLAHTYMLGKAGDSNGCVSFKDYRRFLAAYQRGEIRQLVVVRRMSEYSGTATASAEPSRTLFGRLFSR